MTLEQILDEALRAYAAAALAQWKRDGEKDVGTCGGFMLGYKGNTRFAKLMLERGAGHRLGTRVSLSRPHLGFNSQHMQIDVEGCQAFIAVTKRHGIKPAVEYSYVD